MAEYYTPQFELYELVQAMYGVRIEAAGSDSYYCQCMLGDHVNQPNRGDLRIYAGSGNDRAARGGYVCHKHGSGNAWDFLAQAEGLPRPEDPGFDDTILFICDQLGIEPTLAGDSESLELQARRLLRSIQNALEPIRFPEPNHHYQTQPELLYRGLPPMRWLSHGVGMLSKDSLDALKTQYSQPVFEAAGFRLWKSGVGYDFLTEGVIIMRRGPSGAPWGLALRRYAELTGYDELNSTYIKENRDSLIMNPGSYVFGMDVARRSDEPVLFIVEGELDCKALQLRGIENVVAAGTTKLSAGQMETVTSLGKDLVFIVDEDESGAGREGAAQMAREFPTSQYILLQEIGHDPESFVREYSTDRLLNLYRYTAMMILMLEEPGFEDGRWKRDEETYVQKYMQQIIDQPTAYDERNLSMIKMLADADLDLLKSWLYTARNKGVLDALRDHDQSIKLSLS